MIANTDKCIDSRGEEYLINTFKEIAKAMDCDMAEQAAEKFAAVIGKLELAVPKITSENDIDILKTSVNPVRLKNNPIGLDVPAIEKLYREILGE